MKKWYKRKKIIFLFILVALSGIISINLTLGRLKPILIKTENLSFTKEGFVDASALSRDDVIVASNENFEFHLNEKTTKFYIIDLENGQEWHSNPQEIDPRAKGETELFQNSTLVINYLSGETIKNINNFRYSIQHELSPKEETFAIKYIEDGVQVLYEVSDTSYNISWFPQMLSVARMNELFLEKDNLTASEKRHLLFEYELNENGDHEFKGYKDAKSSLVTRFYEYFYVKSGYTKEDCIKDNAEFGKDVSIDSKADKPFFEVAVEYRLTETGLVTTLINESIVENAKFPIISIDFLPYFGATLTDDEGYFVIPDGSGAIMNFNNGKGYASPYSKRYYGDDIALKSMVKPEYAPDLMLPVYGIVHTNTQNAMLAIIEKGAPMTLLYADVSDQFNSYNRINLKFNYKESEIVTFANAGEILELDMWTKTSVENDFVVNYQFIKNEEANYVGLAKKYQEYLVNQHGMVKTDNTTKTVLNLKLLGMYEKQEYFLGVPYTSTKTLTTFDEARKILDELNTLGIQDINLTYDGWFNGGMDHKIPTDIKIDKIMGGENGLKDLLDYTKEHEIGFYPSMNIMKVNEFDKYFDSIRYTSRHINGKTAIVNHYHLAVKLMMMSKTEDYVLVPNLYHSLMVKMLSEYDAFNISGIALNDLGSETSGDYRKYKEIFRDEDQAYQMDALNLANENYDLMIYSPNAYAIPYATNILNLPQESSQYPILDNSIPFYQLVLNGYIDYAGVGINENVERDTMYYKLKAIETGSNVNYIWSYQDSSVLLGTDYNYYYSTNYRNWISNAAKLVEELNNLGIHESIISNHEVLAKGVYEVSYENGKTFIINYNSTPYLYIKGNTNIEVLANNYHMIGG